MDGLGKLPGTPSKIANYLLLFYIFIFMLALFVVQI